MKFQSVVSAFAVSSVGLVISACAATSTAPEPSVQVVVGAAPGDTVLCKTDYAIGSHYQTQTECMTSEEKQQMQERTRQQMQEYNVQSSVYNRVGGH